MDIEKTIIQYIEEQSDRYDIKNLQFEQDIKFQLLKLTDKYTSAILDTVRTDINTVLGIEQLMIRINNIRSQYLSACKKLLLDKFIEYYNVAYKNSGDLIELGNELTQKFNHKVGEIANKEYDDQTIDFIEKHAFELLTNHTYQQVEKIRGDLGNLFLSGKASKANIRNTIQKTFDVNRSKANEIAQTELSRAYNMGSLQRYKDYEDETGENIKKYWHGFKYSEKTCEYCRPRIGSVYDLDDDTETLPAHPNCRCVWLPYFENWGKPIDTKLISRANMLNTVYNKEIIYQRINTRLGINYAEYISQQAAEDYLSGDRSSKVYDEFASARSRYIENTVVAFDIAKDVSNVHMSYEFNKQMDFWKKYAAGLMADNDKDGLVTTVEAIKGVMLLPWNSEQIGKWNQLIDKISNFN